MVSFPKTSAPESLSDLRPISILPTLSKIFEIILEGQLRAFFADTGFASC